MRRALLATALLLAPGLALAQVCPVAAEAPPQSAPRVENGLPDLSVFPAIPPAEIARTEALRRIAGRGATLRDMGKAGPFRLVLAHTSTTPEAFGIFEPDPRWVVRGPALLDYAAADPAARNVILQRARLVPGLVPTVDMRQAQQQAPAEDGNAVLARIEREAQYGTIGPDGAPRVWAFFDPRCPFSKKAMEALRPLAEAGRLQVVLIPTPLLDKEPGGPSAALAAALLSRAGERMDADWQAGAPGEAIAEGTARMEANRALAAALRVGGSPTLVWRETDGTPRAQMGAQDMPAVLASLGVRQ